MLKSSQGKLPEGWREWLPLFAGAGLALAGTVGGFLFFGGGAEPSPEAAGAPTVEQAAAAPVVPDGFVRRLTDGVYIAPEQQPQRWFAVMVENSADAWPLSGISQARLVIEAPVEGSIPRLSAYFDDTQTEVKQIGPVRSLRPYYSDWATGFEAMVAHVGGSPEALAAVDMQRIVSLNEFYWGRFFWRSLDRYAPHNVYTSIGLLNQGFEARGFEDVELPMFTYADAEPAADARPDSQTVSIPFSSASSEYTARWEYHRETNEYRRYQGSAPAADEDGTLVAAKNVVVMYADIRVIDEVGRRSVKTTGQGEARLLRDGLAFEGRWEKTARTSALAFVSEGGNPLAFQPGTTWIEVIPLSTSVSITPEPSNE